MEQAAFRLPRLREDLSRGWMEHRRRRFAALPVERLRLPEAPVALPEVEVFSLACERDVAQQTLSFLSFIHHVGVPARWTLVSDGSHTEESRKFFGDLHPCLQIRPWTDFVTPANRGAVEPYEAIHSMGKKLAVMSSLSANPISMYIDSDILFFARGGELRELLLKKARGNCFYMPDPFPAKNPPVRPEEMTEEPGVNAGFVIQGRVLDWREVLRRAEELLVDEPEKRAFIKNYLHIFEQMMVHLVFSGQGALALGPEYCVTNEDLTNFFDTAARRPLVARHYIWALKHHMWHHDAAYRR